MERIKILRSIFFFLSIFTIIFFSVIIEMQNNYNSNLCKFSNSLIELNNAHTDLYNFKFNKTLPLIDNLQCPKNILESVDIIKSDINPYCDENIIVKKNNSNIMQYLKKIDVENNCGGTLFYSHYKLYTKEDENRLWCINKECKDDHCKETTKYIYVSN